MRVEEFVEELKSDFYTGVPDSQLKALCNYAINTWGISNRHIIAANEGNATALAAGYYLSTGKIPVVYMQNSGLGNITNPVASLLHEKVYAIPCIFIVGWRGEPGVYDEPQHIFQGEATVSMLQTMDIPVYILEPSTTKEQLKEQMKQFDQFLKKGKSVAFVVKKGALKYDEKVIYANEYGMKREEVIGKILEYTENDPVISTTGKASRELFELREQRQADHKKDFLTVGSMGHCSSIALGVALEKPNQKVWCIDGDGAALMHMGAMPVIASQNPTNLVHIVLNNGAHETVGGMPTVMAKVDLPAIAKACGYKLVLQADQLCELDQILKQAKESTELAFVEIKCGIGAREDLGRPTTTAKENKENFMEYLRSL